MVAPQKRLQPPPTACLSPPPPRPTIYRPAQVLEAIEDDLKALLADALQEMLTPHKAPLTMEHLLRTSVRRRMLRRGRPGGRALSTVAGLTAPGEGWRPSFPLPQQRTSGDHPSAAAQFSGVH